MYLSSDNNFWMVIVNFFINIFDTSIAKFLFAGLVFIVYLLISIKKRSYGEDSPDMNAVKVTTEKLSNHVGKGLLFAATAFIAVQLVRIIFID